MVRNHRKNVGVIGLGIIGSRVAAGLRAAGFSVFVWNRTPQAAPNFLGSPAEVARASEIIQLLVADARAVFSVIEAMGDALTPQHIIICSATIGREATAQAAKMVEKSGARFLDAPFTGSKAAAEKRQLVYYVGGDEPTFLRVKPMLEATSKAIVPVGKICDAAVIKVVTNMIAAVSIQALSEALAIVRKAGLEPEVLAAALEHNACRSGTIEIKLPKMISGDFEPHFSLKHMFKDVQLGVQMAAEVGVESPAATVTAGVMYGAINHGWADLDFASIFKIYDTVLDDRARRIEPKSDAAAELPVPSPDALEVVSSVPRDAKAATENPPPAEGGAPPVPNDDEPSAKPFNRVKRFFSADQQ